MDPLIFSPFEMLGLADDPLFSGSNRLLIKVPPKWKHALMLTMSCGLPYRKQVHDKRTDSDGPEDIDPLTYAAVIKSSNEFT